MKHASEVRDRRVARLRAAGERWQRLTDRRAETVRRLRRGGPLAADAPAKVQQYLEREEAKQRAYARAGVTGTYFQERRIGRTLDLDEFPPDDIARKAGIPVGRLVEVSDEGEALEGFATGFLVAPGLMMTNHHVFGTAGECRGCGIQFGYELDEARQVIDGPVFGLDPDRFFFTSEPLDFSVVAVMPAALSGPRVLTEFNSHHLSPALGKILVGQTISIIQYPDGGPKKYGVRDNELLVAPAPDELFLQYTTDTLPGSSGSPAFNKDWEVVALHHSGVPEVKNGQILTIRGTPWTKGMPDSEIHWIANEGVRTSKLCDALISAAVEPRYRDAWADLIQTFQEDFSVLPAMQTAASPSPDSAVPNAASGPLSIVVNGPATFNFGAPALANAASTTPRSTTAVTASTAPELEKKLVFDPKYGTRPGYKDNFLKIKVPLPDVVAARKKELLKNGSAPLVLKYHHYSLVMNKSRRLQMWSAVNVDYTPSKRRKSRDDFGVDTWVPDPRIAGELQIEDQQLYDPAKKFDRGHIVRREDTAWGDTAQEEIFANSDSFHWTNCTPQHEQFNRAAFQFHGLWGQLENHIQSQAKNVGQRMSIFAGPILNNANDITHDFGGGMMRVPGRFWKILIVTEDANTPQPKLRAYGFVLDQRPAIKKFGLEKFSPGDMETFQVTIGDITKDAGVVFPKVVRDADAMAGAPDEARRIRIDTLEKVRI
jgi:endonuclease G